jgi:hypothetical protein
MKSNHYKIIIFLLANLLFFSCSNDFLYEKSPLAEETATLESAILVSPTWDAKDYPILAPKATINTNFRIIDAPEWLILSSISGKFSNGTAYINCSAREMKEFSKIGIYHEVMTIEDERDQKYFIQVAYVNEGNPRIETPEKIAINPVYYNFPIRIFNKGEGILIWQMIQCPEWLDFQNYEQYPSGILMQDDVTQLYCNVNFDIFFEVLKGQIVIANNDKTNPQKVIDVSIDLGNPRIYISSFSTLDFGKTATLLSLEFSNQHNGILTWQLSDLPEWLTCSETKGMLFGYNWKTVTFTADRSRVPEGVSTTTIYLNSNDAANPRIPITVKIRNITTNPANVTGIDGTVTDACFDKSSGKLYYTTAQPNRFVEFDIASKTVTRSLSLTKAPSCFSISDNGQEVAIGQAGQFSIVNFDNFTLSQELNANYQINDIAWATDDMVVYTPQTRQWDDLCWTNIRTNSTTNIYGAYYGSIIKKISGHDYMLYTDLNLYPGGISVYNIQTKDRQYYTHESIGNFWFSQNGKYLFCGNNQVYRIVDLVSKDNILPIANFNSNYSSYPVWIDDSNSTDKVWVLQSSGDIAQYEAVDFKLVKTINYNDFYIKNGTEYEVSGHYIFADEEGTKLIVLSNAINDSAVWSMELISVP